MPTLNISVSFAVPEGSREQSRIMAALDAPAKAFEEEIKIASGLDVQFEMRVVRHKEKPAAKPALRAAE